MGLINIVSVGWTEDDLTLGVLKLLKSGMPVYLKTSRCGAADWLDRETIDYTTFDDAYQNAEDFDALADRTASALRNAAEKADIVFCVNDAGDETVRRLTASWGNCVRLYGGVSEESCLNGLLGSSYQRVSASDIMRFEPSPDEGLIVCEISDRLLAGEVKTALSDYWPDDWPVYMLKPDKPFAVLPLFELDRQKHYDHMTHAALLPITDLKIKQRYSFRDLMKMMSILRSADGCPWDREQTHESLRPYIIEEAYETVDAINRGDGSDMCEELGDVLYQIAFHAQIAREFDEFDISDVTTAICQKMIRRHPHVFGDKHCDTAQEVVAVWDEAKAQEKAYTSLYEKLAKIPLAMPALTRASKVAKAMDLYAVNDDPLDDSWGERFYRMVRDCRRAGLDPESELSEALRRRVERSANNEVPEPKDK